MRSASVHDRKNSLCSRCPKTLLPCGWRPSQTREFTHTSSGRPLFGALRRGSGANGGAGPEGAEGRMPGVMPKSNRLARRARRSSCCQARRKKGARSKWIPAFAGMTSKEVPRPSFLVRRHSPLALASHSSRQYGCRSRRPSSSTRGNASGAKRSAMKPVRAVSRSSMPARR